MNVQYNPFYYGGTLKESRLFVGRKREVAEICEAIAASASVSVVGERKVGKSSLLLYLADPSIERENGLDIAHYVFDYFDFLGYPTITPNELWRLLLTEMLGQLRESALAAQVRGLLAQDGIELADLECLLKGFKDVGLNLVILLDEFDTAATNPNFDQTFFGGLRNLANNYPLSYVVASHRSMSKLRFAHPDTIVSPFFNIFRRVTLGGFTPDEIEALLTGSLAGTGITFNAGDREMLDFLADSHPFFLQMAAYFLFDAYRYNYLRGKQVDYHWVQGRMRDNAVEHFSYYWDGSEAGEKMILATLSLLESDELESYKLYPHQENPMLNQLKERVLVVEGQRGKSQLFSTLFNQWIAETVSFVPVENVADFKAAIERAKVRGFAKTWLDTTERLRRGFAWVDVKAIAKWLLMAKGAEYLLDWMGRLLQLAGR
jgi:hypothetical protein